MRLSLASVAMLSEGELKRVLDLALGRKSWSCGRNLAAPSRTRQSNPMSGEARRRNTGRDDLNSREVTRNGHR
jgi:hypothetical protein